MNASEVVKIHEWRCSVKKFDNTKKIPAESWVALEQTLVLSPSSYGLQPWKFLVVKNPEVRKQLTPLSWGQTQVEDCSHFVVMAYLNKMDEAFVNEYMRVTAETRGVPLDKLDGFKKMLMQNIVEGLDAPGYKAWATRQVYIALGNLMTSAAALGIDTCPMEGIDPAKYDEVLGLKGTLYSTVVACAVGYRHAEDGYSKLKKVRFPASQLVQNI